MLKLSLSVLFFSLPFFTSCDVNPKKNMETSTVSKSDDYKWLIGKKFVQSGYKFTDPELGGPGFVQFISKERVVLKIGDIAVDSKPKYNGEKISIVNEYTNSEIVFTIIDNKYLIDNFGDKWYAE